MSNVTLDPGSKTGIVGNVTLSDSKTYIGLVTASIGSAPTLYAVVNTGSATDPKIFIGLTTTVLGSMGVISTVNSSTTVLGNASVFTGTSEDVSNYADIRVSVFADQASATDGLSIQQSSNGTNWDFVDVYSIPASTGKVFDVGVAAQYARVVYTNGVTPNTVFRLQTAYHKSRTKPSSQRPQDARTNDNDMEENLAYGMVYNGTTWDRQKGDTTGGAYVQNKGNITISDSKGFIGLVTVVQSSIARTFSGNVTLSDSKTFIGLVTVGNTVTVAAHGITGNMTLSNSQNFIGLVTVVQSSAVRSIAGNITLSNSQNFIGLVTVVQSSAIRSIAGNITITSGTVSLTGNVTLSDSKTYIGLTTTTLGTGTTFVGLVTAWTRNAGTAKTLVTLPVAMSTSSQATVAVPTNAASIYVTSVLFSSNATVRVSIKSGVTYLTGNASIGITLNPGGGWVETGAPDAPIYMSTPSASINIEKFDMTGTIASLSGKVVYFTE